MPRRLVKRLVDAIAGLLMLPAVLLYRAESLLIGAERAFPGWSQVLSLIPGLIGIYLRRGFYRWTLAGLGENSNIEFGVLFSHAAARIGRNVYIGPYAMIGEVSVEDDCLIGSHSSLINGLQQHGIARTDIPIREQPGEMRPVSIGRGAWIGERAIVAADVGDHAIVGAGSTVTRPIPNFAIALGSPARVHRLRTPPQADPIAEAKSTAPPTCQLVTT